MNEHHRVAFVEFVKERIEDPLAEIDTAAVGQKLDAIGVWFVESVGELDGERKTVTVLFADIKGSDGNSPAAEPSS
jgi:class 3 adenylate cyclase